MRPLTCYTIARKNISQNTIKKFCLIAASVIFTLFLFAITLLITNLSNDAQTMANRLGADIMIVPAGYDPHVDSVLLSGKPSALYLPENSLETVKELSRKKVLPIEKISPQVFMATLRASCCAYPVQIMGIDYDSDFIVRSWLNKISKNSLNDDEIILGFHNAGNIGDEIVFFDQPLKIVGKLEQTGMKLDSSVFVNHNTIVRLANAADKLKKQKLAEDNNLISVIMIKLKPASDSQVIARELNKELNPMGMYAMVSKKFVGNISSNLIKISGIIKYPLAILWLIIILFMFYKILARQK